METPTWEDKERLLRMILKIKKKRKPAKVVPTMKVADEPALFFPTKLETVWYHEKSDEIRQNLREIIKNS